jgi:hypothetical protein
MHINYKMIGPYLNLVKNLFLIALWIVFFTRSLVTDLNSHEPVSSPLIVFYTIFIAFFVIFINSAKNSYRKIKLK